MFDKTFFTNLTRDNLQSIFNAYRQAVDLNIICSITDYDGNIIYANKKFCEISGYLYHELIGQNHRIVNSGFHPKDFFKTLWDTIKNGNIWQGDVKCKRKDGTYFWLHSVILPIFNSKGEIVQFFSLRNSIDEQKNAEEERNQHIKSLEDILVMISHKVRQPVASILGISDLLDNPNITNQEINDIVGYIKESAILLDSYTRELNTLVYNLEQVEIKKVNQ